MESRKGFGLAPLCSAGVSGGTLRKRIEEIMTKTAVAELLFPQKCTLGVAAVAAVAVPLALGIGGGSAIARASDADLHGMTHRAGPTF
jgi:hypothetical protein